MDVDNALDYSYLATQCLRMWLIVDRKRDGRWKGKGNSATALPLKNHIFDDRVRVEVINSFMISEFRNKIQGVDNG